MLKVSVLIASRHATSISIEDEFYQELLKISKEQGISRNQLITKIDRERDQENLSSAIRLYILNYYKEKLCAPK